MWVRILLQNRVSMRSVPIVIHRHSASNPVQKCVVKVASCV